jgi:hypothetical protein
VQQHLKQHGRRGEMQLSRVVEAVTQMRDEMKGMRVGQGEMGRLVKGMGKGVLDAETKLSGLGSTVRAIQRELASRAQADKRLADQVDQLRRQGAVMGQAVMGQAVRAGMVDEGGQLAAESGGQQISPPDTVRKQKGVGRRMGGVSGRQLQFGSGTEEKEQEQQKEEKESEEEGGLWSRSQAFLRDMDEMERDDAEEQENQRGQMSWDEQEQEAAEETIDEMYERMMKEVDEEITAEKEAQVAADEAAVLAASAAEKVRQQRESRERVMMRKRRGEESVIESVVKVKMDDEEEASRVSWMCPCVLCDGEVKFWVRVRDGMREERAKQAKRSGGGMQCGYRCGTKVRLRCWELVPQEGDGGERYEWEVRVVQEEMRVLSEGDEKREEEKREVQPFGCASTSS